MPTILHLVHVRWLRRAPHSSVSLLTSFDVSPEPFSEIQEQYASLLDCVWKCEARERQTERQERLLG